MEVEQPAGSKQGYQSNKNHSYLYDRSYQSSGMDVEQQRTPATPSDSQKSTASRKVRVVTKTPASTVDRSQKFMEIGIRVDVFNSRDSSFAKDRVYFIDPDIKVWEFCDRLRNEFNIMDDPKSRKPELFHYKLFFENLHLDENKRFAELNFVSGDKFSFCPQFFAPKEASGKLAEYLDFVFNSKETSQFSQSEQLFLMSRNDFKVTPSIRELSRMAFYELGSVKKFKLENEYGRIEFLEPVDLR